jgi:hypothetical protein
MKFSRARLQLFLVVPILCLAVVPAMKQLSGTFKSTYNYVPVEAQMVSYGELCRVYGETPEAQAVVDQSPKWARGAWGDCVEARDFKSSGITRYHRMDLIKLREDEVLTVNYTAPADGSLRVAQLEAAGRTSRGSDEPVGSAITISAHSTNPELVSWPD